MAEGSFFERVEELKERVGEGDLKGSLEVDTPYAFNQHESYWVNFMGRYGFNTIDRYHNGGGGKFVEEPLLENHPRYLQHLADAVLDGVLVEAMVDNVEDMNDALRANAPEKTGRLKNSGTTSVTDNGALAHYQPGSASGAT